MYGSIHPQILQCRLVSGVVWLLLLGAQIIAECEDCISNQHQLGTIRLEEIPLGADTIDYEWSELTRIL